MRAGARLPGCAARWARKLGVSVDGVRIASPPKRWGSCDAKGVLRFNWRIVQAPARLVDYVVAHEVVHRIHDHHGPDFWATLGRLMPDCDERRLQLRDLGPRLVW
jgi:predicted metal-dependent hydrolase